MPCCLECGKFFRPQFNWEVFCPDCRQYDDIPYIKPKIKKGENSK